MRALNEKKEPPHDRMNAITRPFLVLLLWLAAVPFAAAQAAPFRYDLLNLLPDDFAFCVVMHDLRGHADRWERSDWLKGFRASPLARTLFETAEIQQLKKVQADLKKHFDVDWPTLRDDILGDTLILAYTPGAKNQPNDERGFLLLHARKPERLHDLIEKFNNVQIKSKELKSVDELRYKGEAYQRRNQGSKTQFYYLKDALAVFTFKEEQIKAFLDRRAASAKESPWAKRFEKAGADQAFVALCVNPRMLDAELLQNSKKDDALPSYWRALDAIFVTLAIHDDAELRLSIQADAERLPKWARSVFTQTIPPSSLWQHFPEESILTIATQTDFAGAADALKLLMPAQDQKKMASSWQGGLGAILRIDLFKDLLPNIGPDWGVCVLPSKDARRLPEVMVALAVKPGSKEPPVDQALLKAVEFFAQIAVLDHNKNRPGALLRLQSVMQDKVEVKYLAGDKVFPPGIAPAYALKDGFLLFASSPETIGKFKAREKKAAARKETPLIRLSTQELARLLEHRREHVLAGLADRQQMSPDQATQNLENVIAFLKLFDRATLSQHGDAGQASWIVRLSPRTSRPPRAD